MATQTTGGGSTTSFTNTPQAQDDTYSYLEDLLRSNSTLYNAYTNTLYLDVMSNDLGGGAKTLFSVEDGDGNPLTADYTLLAKDVDSTGASPWEETFNHNWVRINNGKIEYRIADGSGIPGQGRSVDSLTAGEIFSDQFVYSIRLGNGTLSEATVKINITGANDQASISVVTGGNDDVTEAGGVGNSIPGDPTAGGTLHVNDPDLGEDKFQTPAVSSLNGTYGTFTFDPVSGVWTYALDNNRTATQGLAAGASATETLTVTSFDGSTSHTITVNVHGTNDAPVAVADTVSITENQTVLVDVLANDTDVDAGHSFSLVSASAPAGKGSASIVSGQVQFNPGTDFDHLAQGATETVVVNYTMQDEHGATSTSTLTLTITGTNDGPVAVADTASITENQTVQVDVLANDTDVDDGHSLSLVSASAPAGKGTASIVAGKVEFNPGTDFDHLAQGVSETVVVNYTMQDEHSATSSSTVTITVTGTNDMPVATASSDSLFEDSSVSGSVAATDVDDGATLSFALTGAPPAGLTFHSDGSYSFDASSYDGLAEGETLDVIIPFTATDEHGATSAPANLTITITGVNDAPTVTDVSVTTAVEDGPAVGGSFSGDDVDSDDSGSTLTYTVTSTPSEGSVVNNGDGTFSFNPGTDFQDLAEGETRQVSFTYTATDSHLAVSNSGTVTVTVTGTNDTPDIRVEAGDSAGHGFNEGDSGLSTSGSLTVTDPDTSDTIDTSVSLVVIGNQGALSNGDLAAMFSITGGTGSNLAADTGDLNNLSWSFDSGSEAFDFLAEGQTLTLTYTLTSDDGNGGTDSQDVTITITGTNDAPELSASVTDHNYTDTANDDSFSAVTGTLSTVDPDSGDTATYSIDGGGTDLTHVGYDTSASSAYGTLYLNSSSGAYEFVPNDTAIEALKSDDSATFTLRVTDSQSASDTQTLTIHIDGANDTPELSASLTSATFTDTASDDSFSAANGTLTSTDRDSPETATYGVLGGGSDNSQLGYDVSKASAFGTLYVNSSTGAYTFIPDDAAIEGLKTSTSLFFTLQVTDGSGATDNETLTINLDGANDTPEAPATNSVTTDEDTASSAVVIGASDRDAGEVLTYSVKPGDEPAHGSVTFDQTLGTFSYTPAADYNGGDSFTILVTDASGATTEQVVTVTINAVADIADDSDSTNEDTAVTTNVLANDSFEDAGAAVTGVTQGAHGSVVNNGDGTVTYTPNANYNGSDSYTYTVTSGGVTETATVNITIDPVNDAPTSANGSNSTNEDVPLSSTLPAATDVDGDSITYSLGTNAAHGNVVVNPNGTFTYTPTADYNGSDSFTFTVSDGNGGSNTYTYSLTVNPVADIVADSATTNEDTAVTTSVLANDSFENAGRAVTAVTQGAHGTVVNNGDGTITYTPNADYNGSDSYSYTVTSGGVTETTTVSVTINPVADAVNDTATTNAGTAVTTNVLANDNFEGSPVITNASNGANGTVTFNGTSTTYTPNADFSGADSYTYTVTSGGVTESATVNVTVNAPNAAVNDKLVVSSGTTATFSTSVLTGNDTTQLQVVSVAGAAVTAGHLTFNATTQTFVYASTTGAGAGAESFTYTLSDGSTATVTFDVVNANSNTFNLTTESGGIYAAAGSYQGSYIDLANGNDTGTGSAAPDTLIGGNGTDTLNGGSGADILRGGQDNDTLNGNGDAGQFDLIDLSDGTASSGVLGITFTLDQSAGTHSGNFTSIGLGTDTYQNMEGVIGTNFNDTLTGSNTAADELRGGAGNDTLNGQGGNDILKGDAGNDTMTGGAGNDTFVLGPTGVDTITDYSNVLSNADVIDVSEYVSVAAGTDVIGGQYIRVTTTGLVQIDADGGGTWVTVANVNVGPASYNIQYYSGGVLATVNVTPSGPPVALDMDGDGHVSFIGTDAGATFDYGAGTVATAWVAGNDGILVNDANHDGQASATEIVFATSGSDLEGLAVYDSNHDGQLSSADAAFADFAVWQDANSNGVVEAGEMKSLTVLGIASISLSSDGIGYSAAGGDVQVVGTGSYTRTDGSTGVLADAVFATGASQDQKQALAPASSNAALIGAIAAAGLASGEPLAAAVVHDGDHSAALTFGTPANGAFELSPAAASAVAKLAAAELMGQSSGDHQASASASANASSEASEVSAHLDAGSPPAAPSELPQGNDAPAHNEIVDAIPLAAPSVAMPSAEQLAGLAGAPGADGMQHNQVVGQILADALHGGGEGPNVDMLLATLPGGANEGLGSMGHGDALAMMSSGHDIMPQHLMMDAAIHPDAPPA